MRTNWNPNYLVGCLISLVVFRVFGQQNRQPSFDELNQSFQNLLMQHHHPHVVPTSSAGGPDGFAHHSLGFDHLRALQSHPLVFPPYPTFGAGAAGFGLSGTGIMGVQSQQQQQQIPTQQPAQQAQVHSIQPQFLGLNNGQLVQQARVQAVPIQAQIQTQSQAQNQQEQFLSLNNAQLVQSPASNPSQGPVLDQLQGQAQSLVQNPVQGGVQQSSAQIKSIQSNVAALSPNSSLSSAEKNEYRNFEAPRAVPRISASPTATVFSTAQLRPIVESQHNADTVIPVENFTDYAIPVLQRVPTQPSPGSVTGGANSASPSSASPIPNTISTKIEPINAPSTFSTTVAPTIIGTLHTSSLSPGDSNSPIAKESKNEQLEIEKGIDRIKLSQHLNKADLTNLLHAANFSAGDAKVFLKLVEKVLENEVTQRLTEMQAVKNSSTLTANSTTSASFKTTAPAEAGQTAAETDEKSKANKTENHRINRVDDDSVHRKILSIVVPPIHYEDASVYRQPNRTKYSADRNEEPLKTPSPIPEAELGPFDTNMVDLTSQHQLKTVNTHLNYGSRTLDVEPDANADTITVPHEKLKKADRNNYGVRIANNDKDQLAYTAPITVQTTVVTPVSIVYSYHSSVKSDIVTTTTTTTSDYRTKEQADFDQLLEQLATSYVSSGSEDPEQSSTDPSDYDSHSEDGYDKKDTQTRINAQPQKLNGLLFRGGGLQNNPSDSGLPLWRQMQNADTNIVTASLQKQQNGFLGNSGRNHRGSNRHPPHTAFEHLFEDYRYRLSGQNGVNDVVKALRNAHISFYERRGGERATRKNGTRLHNV